MTSWRLIDSGSLDAFTNMALDEALLACFDPEHSRPVLRLYGWNPPAFSLGRFQDAEAVLDLEKCSDAGISVVRRMTGGGALFHADELTYSLVCAPRHISATASVKDSFRELTRFLICFYSKLGLTACHAVNYYPPGTKLGVRAPFCPAGKESCDIIISGKKIGGNAQRRLKNVIFQHGSIPLVNNLAKGVAFLRESPAGIEAGVAALSDCGVRRDVAELVGLLTDAFQETGPRRLVADELSDCEQRCSERCKIRKYLRAEWNLTGELR